MLILGFVCIVISNLFAVISPGIVRNALDGIGEAINLAGEPGADRETIGQQAVRAALLYAGVYMLYSLLKGLFLFFTRQTIIVMSRYIEYGLKNEIFSKYQALSLSFYRRNNTGDLMNRISEDVSRVRMYLGPGIMYTLNLAVLFVMIIFQMLKVNTELTLYVLSPLPIMAVLIYYISNRINRKSEAVQAQQSRLTVNAQETFSGIRVIKTFGKEQAIREDFNRESEQYKNKVLSLVRTDALFSPVITLLVGLSTILTIYIGSLQALQGKVSVGNIAEFVIYVNMLTWPFASVGWVTSLIQRAAASQERINEFLRVEPDIVNPTHVPEEITGKLEFRNITFRYPDSGITALRNFSVTVEPGQTLAIIGKTGSGKSTVAALTSRLFDPTSGEVLIDGKPMQSVNLDSLRSAVGYVPQEVFLFSDTLANNIAFGLKAEETSREKIEQAARDAAIYDNIMEFPKGFETMVGERGITLSGGQKQRTSIARAIIREPKILVFDDCLSAVDTETEDEILRNLRRIMKNRTSIIISHRVSSVKHADHIIVLHHGEIVEQGNHTTLIDQQGIYFDLYRKQLLEEEKMN